MNPACRCLGKISLFLLSFTTFACDDIEITAAWVREPPQLSDVAAAYFIARNVGANAAIIESTRSSCCQTIYLHVTTIEDEHARMQHLNGLMIAAGDSVSLEPGAAHLMLSTPVAPISHGQVIDIEFSCSVGTPMTVEFDVVAKH